MPYFRNSTLSLIPGLTIVRLAGSVSPYGMCVGLYLGISKRLTTSVFVSVLVACFDMNEGRNIDAK